MLCMWLSNGVLLWDECAFCVSLAGFGASYVSGTGIKAVHVMSPKKLIGLIMGAMPWDFFSHVNEECLMTTRLLEQNQSSFQSLFLN
ncbi:unnamed protein product [Sphenostylis stenocarpa]|uniref:Uncharacterized protein n=1 Tax=Sphenostylis stenocarpa TaxID=92480 RepID=A0AA87B848_9FABA|nr:unnamed protein product [Sphenostylis stenocarpa]